MSLTNYVTKLRGQYVCTRYNIVPTFNLAAECDEISFKIKKIIMSEDLTKLYY